MSFNIKCFASEQVIAENERCRVAVIIQNATYAPAQLTFGGQPESLYGIGEYFTGASCFWAPMSGLLSGEYRDNAKVRLDATVENQAILAEFFNGLFKVAATAVSDRDVRGFDFKALVQEVAPKLFSSLSAQTHPLSSLAPDALDLAEAMALWDALQDGMYQNAVYASSGYKVLRPVKLAAMHEVTFEHLAALTEGVVGGQGVRPYAREAYIKASFDEASEQLAEESGQVKQILVRDMILDRLRLGMDSAMTRAVHWAFRRHLAEALNAGEGNGQPVATLLEMFKAPLDILYALKGLELLRLQFSPITYAGQDYDNIVGRDYAEFVKGASAAICAQRAARFGDD